MALIVCNKCGKKVSDTVKTCIHCGALLSENATQRNEPREPQENFTPLYEVLFPNFKDLSEGQQNDLENEFLKSDKRARSFYRKGVEIKKFCLILLMILPFFGALHTLQAKLIERFQESEAYSQKMIDIAEKFALSSVFVWLFVAVVALYYIIVTRSKYKQQIYLKKLQKWLKEEKGVIFNPTFMSEKEKNIFEQIDLNNVHL